MADLADALADLWNAVHQPLEVVRVEDEELAVVAGAHRRVAHAAGEDRDLAEELALPELHVLRIRELDLHLARHDEIHRVGLLAAAGDDLALARRARVEELHDLGERAGAEAVED